MKEIMKSQHSELVIKSVKIIDIVYESILYSSISIFVSVYMNKLFPKFEKEVYEKKSTFSIILEIWLNLSAVAIAAYILHNILEKVPFPLDGLGGFEHKRLKERSGGVIFGFLLFFYQDSLREKIKFLINERINKN